MKKDEMGGHAACTMNMIIAHRILVGKSEEKRHLCRLGGGGYIKVDFKGEECEGVG
jgi:hypothetical protein